MKSRTQQRKGIGILSVTLFFLCLLPIVTGCGESAKEAETTCIQVGKKGTVTSSIVEDFEKEYYSIPELTTMIQEEIDVYNTAHANAITLEETKQSETQTGKVLVKMTYASPDDYTAFNGTILFYGTIAEAKQAGLDLNTGFVSASDTTKKLEQTDLAGMDANHILICSESLQVNLPEKAQYISENVTLISNKSIMADSTESLSYVIMK